MHIMKTIITFRDVKAESPATKEVKDEQEAVDANEHGTGVPDQDVA